MDASDERHIVIIEVRYCLSPFGLQFPLFVNVAVVGIAKRGSNNDHVVSGRGAGSDEISWTEIGNKNHSSTSPPGQVASDGTMRNNSMA